ncbi:MAG TPA: F0F1 ATP synthase subunit A [Streptosporangiaceae bacterium]
MSNGVHATALASGCHIFSGCGYPAPSNNDFVFSPAFSIGPWHVTKPELLMVICVLAILLFFWAAFRRPKLVPRGVQNIGELGVLFVRDQILRPMIGRKGDGYLPFLVSLFFFIWIMNLLEIIPVAQFPVPAHIGFAWILVALVWFTYMTVGIRAKGPIGFFRGMIPSGVPWWIMGLLVPIIWLSDIIVRPFTLGVRLFANMFAGHLLLLVFYFATWYFVSASAGAVYAVGSLAMVIILTAFEMLIQFLQAFIFTMLTAFYIGDSLESAH